MSKNARQFTFDGNDFSVKGEKEVKVTYGERTASFRVQVKEAGEKERLVLADFDFDADETGFTSEHAKASGSYALQESYSTKYGKALYLDGSSNQYLTVTDKNGGSLLTGTDELTISYDAKPDRTDTNWALFAAPDGSAPVYKSEKYLGIMVKGGTTTVERYNNQGSRPAAAAASTGTGWVHVDVVIDKTSTTVYVNGEKKDSQSSTYTLSGILGDNSILQIGKANWGGGEFYKGWLDNFSIRNYAVTEEEVTALAADFMETQPIVSEALVGTAPDRNTALEYRGSDDHTAIRTETDVEKKVIVSYVRKGTDLTNVPVTFRLNGSNLKIEADGAAFTNGGEMNLTKDIQVIFQSGDRTETWTV